MTSAQWTAAGGSRQPALRRGTSLGTFLVIIVLIAVGTAGLVQLLTPPAAAPPCTAGLACSGPPAPPGQQPVGGGESPPPSHVPVGGLDNAPPLTTGQVWHSKDLAFSFEFEPREWAIVDEDGRGVILGGAGSAPDVSLWIAGVPAAEATPDRALASRVDALGATIVGLAEDTRPEARILGPNIGYVDGVGAMYGGAADSPQGPRGRARIAILAATDGHLTLTASLILIGGTSADWKAARQAADTALNTVGWTTTANAGPGTTLRVSGPVHAVEALFATSLERYRDADGQAYLSPTVPPRVPTAFAGVVDGVLGLDGRQRAHPAYGRRIPLGSPVLPRAAAPTFGLRPADVAAAYDLGPLQRAGFDGAGQTVAIVSFDAVDDATIAAFDKSAGISGPKVTHVNVNGGTQPGEGSSEVALDIEVIRGIAPKARILNFEAPNDGTPFADVIDAIVADGRARTISISWGRCDVPADVSTSTRRADERSFQAAVAAGITIFSSSGDFGAYDCRADRLDDLTLTTDWPSGSQYVVSVGGTRLEVRTSGGYLAEQGWEDTLEGSGGGGGIATRETRPSWQVDFGADLAGADGKRVIPDVAASADPDSGFYAVWRGSDGSLVHGAIGGTSAATPFWAGSTLLIRQAVAQAGKAAPGFLAPLLYRVAAAGGQAFHDVVRGGNLGYPAGAGWDPATGLGSPDVARLANALIDALP